MTDYVKKSIALTGHPLEILASSELERRDWMVSNNAPFIDPETGTSRSIDIAAYPPEPGQSKQEYLAKRFEWGRIGGILDEFTIWPEMIVECKKSENAWVFFKRKPFFHSFGVNTYFHNPIEPKVDSPGGILETSERSILTSHYKATGDPAISYVEVNLKKGQPQVGDRRGKRKEIFPAVMQLVKYVDYHTQRVKKRRYCFLEIRFPVIVFDGPLFAAEVNGDNLDVRATKHVVLETSRILSDYPEAERDVFIDVVSRSAFPELCDSVSDELVSYFGEFMKNLDSHRQYLERHRDRSYVKSLSKYK